MKLRQPLKSACTAAACVVLGVVIGARFARRPAPPARATPDTVFASEAALDRVIPAIDLDEVPFDEAVAKVEQLGGTRLIVDWDALARTGWSRTSPVTFRARDAKLERALEGLVSPFQSAPAQVTFVPVRGGILITTSVDPAVTTPFSRDYDVTDLAIPDEEADPAPSPPAKRKGRRGFAGGGCVVFRGESRRPPVEDLMQLIQDTVAADSWRDAGGQGGSIIHFGNRLVVSQTWSVHRQIQSLLGQLREPGPPPTSPPPSPDLRLWDAELQTYVSTNPEVGDASLRQRLAEVRLDDVPLDQAVLGLREQSHASLVANWGAVESAGVPRDRRVSLRLRDVTLGAALRALLDAAGTAVDAPPGGSRLAVCPDGGHVLITARDDERAMCVRVYVVRDWLAATAAPPGAAGPPTVVGRSRPESVDLQVERVIECLKTSVAPDSWRGGPGDGRGSVIELSGTLVVSQTWENQQKVADVLNALRAAPSHGAPASRPAPP